MAKHRSSRRRARRHRRNPFSPVQAQSWGDNFSPVKASRGQRLASAGGEIAGVAAEVTRQGVQMFPLSSVIIVALAAGALGYWFGSPSTPSSTA